MHEPFGEHNFRQHLTAFADGELDLEQTVRILRYVAEHPEAMAVLEQAWRLHEAARRVAAARTPAVPDELRRKVEAILNGETPALARSPRVPSVRRGIFPVQWGWARTGLAAAVLVFAGGVVGRHAFSPRPPVPPRDVITAADPVPASLVSAVTRVHVDCSRFDLAAHQGGYPQPLTGLADSVKADLAREQPYPDLSGIGYEFVGAGPCRAPLVGTVHLLYRATGGRLRDTLSVFAQAYNGQVRIEPRNAYLVAGAGTAHPMIVWRSDHVVYFIVGDDMTEVDRARETMKVPLPQQ